MKWLLLPAVLMTVPMWGEEAVAPSAREKLLARIIESLPPPAPAQPAEAKPEPEIAVLVLEPMVVSGSSGAGKLGKLLADEKQRQEAESFSPGKGGTLYRNERLELGGWWSRETGWHFLKLKW